MDKLRYWSPQGEKDKIKSWYAECIVYVQYSRVLLKQLKTLRFIRIIFSSMGLIYPVVFGN